MRILTMQSVFNNSKLFLQIPKNPFPSLNIGSIWKYADCEEQKSVAIEGKETEKSFKENLPGYVKRTKHVKKFVDLALLITNGKKLNDLRNMEENCKVKWGICLVKTVIALQILAGILMILTHYVKRSKSETGNSWKSLLLKLFTDICVFFVTFFTALISIMTFT